VTEYFSFFNHADLRVDGGANFLVKFLKAFAAARTPLRIVAVFDNDAIGAVASKQAEDLNLPNISQYCGFQTRNSLKITRLLAHRAGIAWTSTARPQVLNFTWVALL
jgi:hypothetical protein